MPDATAPSQPPLATVRAVELIHAGTWNAKYGPATFTTADLYAAVGALDCPAVRKPVLKFGHDGNHGVGDPAIGWVDNLAVTDDGRTLVGDYVGMPAWLAAPNADGQMVLASAYPDRSVEGTYDFRCQIGHTHPFVLQAVALLGQDRPAVGTLPSLQSLADLYGVAASADDTGAGVPVAVALTSKEQTMPSPRPQQVAAAVSVEDVRRAYYDKAPWSHWIVELHLDPLQLVVADDETGKLFRVPVNVTGDDAFEFGEPVEVRRRYEDVAAASPVAASAPIVFASRAESRPGPAAVAAAEPAGSTNPAEPPAPLNDPAPEPEPVVTPAPDGAGIEDPAAEPDHQPEENAMSLDKGVRERLGLADDADESAVLAALDARLSPEPEPDPLPEPEPQPEPEPVAVAASAPPADPAIAQKVDLLEQQVQAMSAQLAAANAERAAAVKASVLDEAQRLGKFKPADRPAWDANYDKAPDVCASVLASIAPGTAVPVLASGVTGPGEPAGLENNDQFDALFTRKVGA